MEWFRDVQWLGWIGVALVLGLIEIASLDLVFIMLTIAALAAAGVALSGGSFVVQVIVFVVVSGVLLLVARPIALRRLRATRRDELTNAAAYVGRRGEVLEPVTARSGLVKVVGEDWSARTLDETATLAVGDAVSVIRIEGATLIVAATDDDTDAAETDEADDTTGQEAP